MLLYAKSKSMATDILDRATRLSPEGIFGIPLDNSTPASRARLAGLYAGVASLGSLAALLAPSPEAAAAVATATLCCATWAVQAWKASKLPYYLLSDPLPLPVATWQVAPGKGVGPLELGPPGTELLRMLRHARACCWHVGSVAYLMDSPSGWVVVCLLAPQNRTRPDAPPSPAELGDVVWVETGHPFHSTPQGVAPGMLAREVTARLGPPLDTTRPASGDTVLHYPGLRVAIRRRRVRSLRVLTDDPLEAARPWNL